MESTPSAIAPIPRNAIPARVLPFRGPAGTTGNHHGLGTGTTNAGSRAGHMLASLVHVEILRLELGEADERSACDDGRGDSGGDGEHDVHDG